MLGIIYLTTYLSLGSKRLFLSTLYGFFNLLRALYDSADNYHRLYLYYIGSECLFLVTSQHRIPPSLMCPTDYVYDMDSELLKPLVKPSFRLLVTVLLGGLRIMIDGAQGLSFPPFICPPFPSLPHCSNKLFDSIFLLKAAETKPRITHDVKYSSCQAQSFFLPAMGVGYIWIGRPRVCREDIGSHYCEIGTALETQIRELSRLGYITRRKR